MIRVLNVGYRASVNYNIHVQVINAKKSQFTVVKANMSFRYSDRRKQVFIEYSAAKMDLELSLFKATIHSNAM